MEMRKFSSKDRLQQALSVAGGYSILLLGTLVFRQQVGLFSAMHAVLVAWFFYLFHSRSVLGFAMYGLASSLTLLGFLFGGPFFGALWLGAVAFTMFGALNTINITQRR